SNLPKQFSPRLRHRLDIAVRWRSWPTGSSPHVRPRPCAGRRPHGFSRRGGAFKGQYRRNAVIASAACVATAKMLTSKGARHSARTYPYSAPVTPAQVAIIAAAGAPFRAVLGHLIGWHRARPRRREFTISGRAARYEGLGP